MQLKVSNRVVGRRVYREVFGKKTGVLAGELVVGVIFTNFQYCFRQWVNTKNQFVTFVAERQLQ